MKIDYWYFKHIQDERDISNLSWVKTLKKAKAGDLSCFDSLSNIQCPSRPTYKLKSIDHVGRTPLGHEAWSKVLNMAETHARVRAVQMHLNNVTSLHALPLTCGTAQCCKYYQSKSAAVALKDLHTDELEREWIYDTGAATCLIGYDLLTANEAQRIS